MVEPTDRDWADEDGRHWAEGPGWDRVERADRDAADETVQGAGEGTNQGSAEEADRRVVEPTGRHWAEGTGWDRAEQTGRNRAQGTGRDKVEQTGRDRTEQIGWDPTEQPSRDRVEGTGWGRGERGDRGADVGTDRDGSRQADRDEGAEPCLALAAQSQERLAARVVIGEISIDPLTEAQVVEHVGAALEAGRGGRVVTPNVDICRSVARDPALSELVNTADLVVADGMPLVWGSRLLGTPLPERVTGADLIWSLSKLADRRGWPVYLLGGPPGVAVSAARELASCYSRLKVCGVEAPPPAFDRTAAGLERVLRRVTAARPKIVFIGLGFPRQDQLIALLCRRLPDAWFVGCGAAIAFASGTVPRAPAWMREAGLEWLFRLVSEPGRLARRYLVDDLPFAARLLTGCLIEGRRRRRAR
ncbi:WecB/TagA/CpsF family glycosyltransferase [Nonomuraea lactucae]|uniref:WecB/TagA/CpsF family glycosyltransferase n=1 Tax=Nonomuraea lactucae TaxID=2249762 RepID=UPI0023DD1386|nr:WecB/TagA/CpsF family glycosyltransferase [Nonomuraea lactucae]